MLPSFKQMTYLNFYASKMTYLSNLCWTSSVQNNQYVHDCLYFMTLIILMCTSEVLGHR